MNKIRKILLPLLVILCVVSGCGIRVSIQTGTTAPESGQSAEKTESAQDLANIPEYSGSPYVAVNDNVPYFTDEDLTTESFETYSDLDALGRCGVAYANIGTDLMPTEERGSISRVKPTGWHSVKYDCVDGGYVYNRSHLIGYQLTAEGSNERNLITGTRYLNVIGMLPYENMVADYIKETENHVLYRVTPLFEGNNLVASGVLMEAMSVEDEGEGVLFNVFCYNVQPGVTIDYETGDSRLSSETSSEEVTYILNPNTRKFHDSSCSGTSRIKSPEEYTGSREDLIKQGYELCGICNP